MKDGVVLCNAGQNYFEMDLDALDAAVASRETIRPNIEQLTLDDGKRFFLLARGNLINLAGGDGNPIEIMDLGLALQTLSLERLVSESSSMANGPQTVPWDIELATVRAALREYVR